MLPIPLAIIAILSTLVIHHTLKTRMVMIFCTSSAISLFSMACMKAQEIKRPIETSSYIVMASRPLGEKIKRHGGACHCFSTAAISPPSTSSIFWLIVNCAMTTTAALIDSALMAVEWHKDQGCMVSLVITEKAPTRTIQSSAGALRVPCTSRRLARLVSDSALERRKGRFHDLDDRMHTTHVTTTMMASDRRIASKARPCHAAARAPCALSTLR